MNGNGAMVVRSPLTRQRPWVSDGVWIAHESLELFSRIAGLMKSRGRWALTQGGAELRPDLGPGPDLVEMMAELSAGAVPCVVNLDEYQRFDDKEAAMQAVGTQVVEAVDAEGRRWTFDQDYAEVAALGQDGWTWKITHRPNGPAFVGFDRKDRPRFAVMGHRVPVATEPPDH